ncbi:hypothetical protein [Paracoccus sp. (in: a-proteobacteria)]|uniref:hypothetical protein n=1 Tax=Paracoccus sp. TaxID=267 RepID=UPI0026E07241|nr:hypothetical protein [Paracoccus sp. (in: a-proteobacteria)]MDO5648389.1 hypothetical protein [Paracoccus sp. (in: a-proteobacteria)]
MTLAVLKLESFAETRAPVEQMFSRDAVDQAHADGLAQGLARADDAQFRDLTAAITSLRDTLRDDEARRADLRREAVAALAPVLTQILDALTPSAEAARLEKTLLDELHHLAGRARPLTADIACPPALRGLVDRCLAQSGMDGVTVTDSDHTAVTLTMGAGRIEFSPEQTAANIRALIAEMTGA